MTDQLAQPMRAPAQYKAFTTRKFRADLHYRLRMVAARLNISQQDAFNYVVERGLEYMERHAAVLEQTRGGG